MNYWLRVIVFCACNFIGLFIGSLFTKAGVSSTWYQELEKAPWTPPGFVFGFAWTFIMICFGFYMAGIISKDKNTSDKKIILAYVLQWILNVSWNPLFFKFNLVNPALVVIILLFLFVTYFLIAGFKRSFVNGLLILPYFLWLIIAISLNSFIALNN